MVRISSNGEETALTSLQPYANGANQFLSLSLSSSQDSHILTLQTSQETRTERLPLTNSTLQALLNCTQLFLCGVPDDLVNATGRVSNFNGCSALSSMAELSPLPLNCYSAKENGSCSYCLNEVFNSFDSMYVQYDVFPV